MSKETGKRLTDLRRSGAAGAHGKKSPDRYNSDRQIMDQESRDQGMEDFNMRKVTVAFDVDGTLLGKSDLAEEDIRTLLRILSRFRNVHVVVWSGSGKEYAEMRGRQLHIDHWVDQYCTKGAVPADICIDDVETTNLGLVNLICPENT